MGYIFDMSERQEFMKHLSESNYSRLTKGIYYRYVEMFFNRYYEMDSNSLRLFLQRFNGTTAIAAIKHFHTWLLNNDKVSANDIAYKFEKVYPGKPREIIWVTYRELQEILKYMPTYNDRLFTELVFYGAFRVSEALKLTWGNLGWFNWLQNQNKPIVVTIPDAKKGKGQTTTLPSMFAKKLFLLNQPMLDSRQMPYNDKSVIVDFGTDKYLDIEDYADHMRHNYKHRLKKASKSAIGRIISPHKLRHSYAQFLLDNGVGLHKVQRKLRHDSLKATGVYSKSNLNQLSDAEEHLFD